MGYVILAILCGILWMFGSVGLAAKVAGMIVKGDSLTNGWEFWYCLLAPTFMLGIPAIILIANGI